MRQRPQGVVGICCTLNKFKIKLIKTKLGIVVPLSKT